MKKTWTQIFECSPDGHRIFKDQDGFCSIADRSGFDPDHTNDGPCYIDPAFGIELRAVNNNIVGVVHVTSLPPSLCSSQERNIASVQYKTWIWIARELNIPVYLNGHKVSV